MIRNEESPDLRPFQYALLLLKGVLWGLALSMALLVLRESALPEPGLAPWVVLVLVASVSMSIENSYAGGFRPERLGSLELAFVRQFTEADQQVGNCCQELNLLVRPD